MKLCRPDTAASSGGPSVVSASASVSTRAPNESCTLRAVSTSHGPTTKLAIR